MRRVDTGQRRLGRLPRTTQILFGERQSLQNALRLLRSTRLPAERRRLEEGLLRQMIAIRTRELEAINPGWDRRVRRVARRATSAGELRRLVRRTPREDYYLLRLISDHPSAPPDVLARLARHPYRAVRQNVARHPRTPVPTLRALCRDRREPLWYLVAFNPSAPEELREQLRARIQRQGQRR
jgi:hypothetical protein